LHKVDKDIDPKDVDAPHQSIIDDDNEACQSQMSKGSRLVHQNVEKKLAEVNRKTAMQEGIKGHMKKLVESQMAQQQLEQLAQQERDEQCIRDKKAARAERRRQQGLRPDSGASSRSQLSKISRAKTQAIDKAGGNDEGQRELRE
jgi:hypothetical protein